MRTGSTRILALVLAAVMLCGTFLTACKKEEAPVTREPAPQQTVEEAPAPEKETPAETPAPEEKPVEEAPQKPVEEAPQTPAEPIDAPDVQALARPRLLNFSASPAEDVTPATKPYTVEPGLANVINVDRFYLDEGAKQLLAENYFFVDSWGDSEFFERYEYNRYMQLPNFITVDSLMHTYHLYFSLLLKRTERNYLAADLRKLSQSMLTASEAQYDALKGTEWEEAAARNTAFFAVGTVLQNPSAEIPSDVKDTVLKELSAIRAAAGIAFSDMADEFMDYSQFKPRGYYEGDEALEAYFRTMMWYGLFNFTQKKDSLNRSAALMVMAMEEADLAAWEEIYSITSFFAGASDDHTYYEYAPALEAAYGKMPAAADLPGNDTAYRTFCAIVEKMVPPAINSMVVLTAETEDEDLSELYNGFRFMGQRFTIDAAIMQQLVYRRVEENAQGEYRMLPDVLDTPAALGSELALQLLEAQGDTEFAGYSENMQALRDAVQAADEDAWTASLYSSWLYTLRPLLEEKGAGWPSFMTSNLWQLKTLETFAGSYTELKHDTVLYAKQMVAEMGGGPMEKVDDRGYVEPEVEVYRRFMLLAQQTSEGLDSFGMLSADDKENLSRLTELARRLLVISQKELRDELLTDEEYELIRAYGGTLEHFWREAAYEDTEEFYIDSQEMPASLITDIATDPNSQTVLQIANAHPNVIYAVVSVGGSLRIASGMAYDFYQFTQPLSDRMTDTQWRQKIGEWMTDEGTYNWGAKVEKPWWTTDFRYER